MLRADLQRWRGVKAKEIGKPAYVVFDNKTLDLIVEAKPRNLAALGRVKGVGPKKLDDYGAEVLAIIGGDSAGASASAGGAKNPFTLAAERRSNEVGTSSFGAANLAPLSKGNSCPPRTWRRFSRRKPLRPEPHRRPRDPRRD